MTNKHSLPGFRFGFTTWTAAFLVTIFITRICYYAEVLPDFFPIGDWWKGLDFNHYYAGAVLFAQGSRIYCVDLNVAFPSGFRWDQGVQGVTNPPALTMLLAPLSFFSPTVAWLVWIAFIFNSIFFAALLGLKLTGRSWTRTATTIVVLMSVFSYSTIAALRCSQVSPLLLLLVLVGWYYLRRGQLRGAPFWGIAIALKLFLWPIAILLVKREHRLAFLLTGAVAIAMSVIPTWFNPHANWLDFRNCAVPIISMWGDLAFTNVGIVGTTQRFLRLIEPNYHHHPVFPFVVMITGACLIFFVAQRSRTENDREQAFAVAVAVSTLCAPVVWKHYLVLLFPLFLYSWRKSNWSSPRAALLIAIWAALPFYTLEYRVGTALNLMEILLSIAAIVALFATIFLKSDRANSQQQVTNEE